MDDADGTKDEFFHIERAHSKGDWVEIGALKAQNGGNTIQNYAFWDEQPFEISYYRLRMSDWNGLESYSSVVSVQQEAMTWQTYPNPVSNLLQIHFNSTYTAPTRFEIYDALGRTVLKWEGIATFGANQVDYNLENLVSGGYWLGIWVGDAKKMLRFTKK